MSYISPLGIHSFVLTRCSIKIQITWEKSMHHAFTTWSGGGHGSVVLDPGCMLESHGPCFRIIETKSLGDRAQASRVRKSSPGPSDATWVPSTTSPGKSSPIEMYQETHHWPVFVDCPQRGQGLFRLGAAPLSPLAEFCFLAKDLGQVWDDASAYLWFLHSPDVGTVERTLDYMEEKRTGWW